MTTAEDHGAAAAFAATRHLLAFADTYTPEVSDAARVHVVTILWSWWRHCTHLAEGVLAEVERGSPFTADPSLRSMWEHVLRALWLCDEGDQAAADLAADGEGRRAKIAAAIPGAAPAPAASTGADWWSGMPIRPLLDFNALVDRYPSVTDYLHYQLLSNFAHPSYETARLYVRADGAGHASLTNEPASPEHAAAVSQSTVVTHHFLRLLTLLLEQELADPVLTREVDAFLLITGEARTLPTRVVRSQQAAQASPVAARAQSLLDAFAEADASGLPAVRAMSAQGAGALPAGLDELQARKKLDRLATLIREAARW